MIQANAFFFRHFIKFAVQAARNAHIEFTAILIFVSALGIAAGNVFDLSKEPPSKLGGIWG